MKTVLFIAHHFPPMGGPGVSRSLNFVKHLPAYQYQPVVLTISLEDIKEGAYPMDDTLMKQVPDIVTIIRTKTYEPRQFKELMMRLRIFRILWFVLYPLLWESCALWIFSAFGTGIKVIREKNIQLIYTSSGPFTTLLIGLLLKIKLKIKWIADLRDPFTDGYQWHFPSKLHWYFARRIEKWVLNKADHLIVNTPEVKNLFIKRKILLEEKISVITNGY